MFERRRIPQRHHHRFLPPVNKLLFAHHRLLPGWLHAFRYLYYEKFSEEDRQRTYLFNSFFYTRLTRKGNDDISNISSVCLSASNVFHDWHDSRAAERRYSRVKRWLRDVDIFSKDFLIVPINQTAHWYIVLIQNHNHVLTEGDLISDDEDTHGMTRERWRIRRRACLFVLRRFFAVEKEENPTERGE